MKIKNYYKLLKVKPESDLDEIKKAFRIELKKHHPDINKSKDANQHFEDIVEAFEILSKTNKRAFYDSLLVDKSNINSNLESLNKAKQEKYIAFKDEAKLKSEKYRKETHESSIVTDLMLDVLFEGLFDASVDIIEGAGDFFGEVLGDIL